MARNFISEEGKEVRGIFGRLKRRDFSGNTGQAIKNSGFEMSSTIIAKVGSFIFVAFLARILMPNLYGLYSLALSTILIFSVFSDLGIGSALIKFVSKSVGLKRPKEAKAYFMFLLKAKFILTAGSILILTFLARWIARDYYHKPIFYAIIAGVIYLPTVNILGFFEYSLKATNNFKASFFKEIIFQLLRFVIVIPLAWMIVNANLSEEKSLFFLLLAISICYIISFWIIFRYAKKNLTFLSEKSAKLNSREKNKLRSYILPLTALSLSGVFFGYIDTFMLGHFVSGESIGYYSSAFNLVSAASAILGFAGVALLPIFSTLSKSALKRGVDRTLKITILISFLGFVGTLILSKPLIILLYGGDYLPSVSLLQILSVMILITPLVAIYDSYNLSQGRTSFMAKALIATTLLNIILNYYFISRGVAVSELLGVIGACIATIISRITYLVILVPHKK